MGFKAKFTPAKTQKFLGLGQLFTNLLRHSYIDTDQSEATNAYRNWEVRLAHRLGALIRNDTIKIGTTFGILPSTAYNVVLKKREHVEGKWISAIRVQLVQSGTMAAHNGYVVPYEDGADWVFRVETYNPAHPIMEYYDLDTSAEYQTFNALQGESTDREWKHFSINGEVRSVTTPFTVTGVQNLINVLYGYIHRLDDLGFRFNHGESIITDSETGRNLDWQLEIEKLVDRIYRNFAPGEGHILNPFMHSIWLDTPSGLQSQYTESAFIDVSTAQAVFDVVGSAIPVSKLDVVRLDDHTVTYSSVPIFSAHLFIDEYEHVLLMNNNVSEGSDSATIFDPFLGLRIQSAYLDFTRQEETNRKPHFPGFVLSGNNVVRNITSSVDAIGKYYDAGRTFDEPVTAEHALSLLGYNKKSYFNDLGASDATQFNFWRGLIQAKGTNMAIDAFVNYKKFTKADVDEYWAYKIAEYGDARLRSFPEVKVEVADCIQKFTQLQFFTDTPSTPLPNFTQIESNDDTRWFSIDDLGQEISFDAEEMEFFVETANLQANTFVDVGIFHNSEVPPNVFVQEYTYDHEGGLVVLSETSTVDALMVNASTLKIINVPSAVNVDARGVRFAVRGYTWVNPTKVSPVKLFDYVENEMIKEFALWHPAIGIHAYEPLEIISSITSKDPAFYNTTGQTVKNPNYVALKAWGKKEVGRVWWNTANLGYIPYYDATIFSDRNERHARWGNLAEWASIDLYEWVESDVPPSEYDALALEEEGASDIPAISRASGKAARKTNYRRNRSISVKPIAWSKSLVGGVNAHPAFGPGMQRLIVADNAIYVDAGRLEDFDIVPGNHVSAWKNNTPFGEIVVNEDSLVYDIGSSATLSSPSLLASGLLTSISISAIPDGRIGSMIGRLTLTVSLEQRDSASYIRRLRITDQHNTTEEVALNDWLPDSDNTLTIEFPNTGLRLTVVRDDMTSTYLAGDLATDIAMSWVDVYVREGNAFTQIIALPDTIFINDESDPDYATTEYGWVSFEVPTQDDLDSDLAFPHHKWFPYIGANVEIIASSDIIKDIGVDTLTLRNGIPIKRYTTSWTDWEALNPIQIQKISNETDIISFSGSDFLQPNEAINPNRVSVFVDGIQISPKNYVITSTLGSESIALTNILHLGAKALLVYRAYEPTAAELAFNPEEVDNPSIQVQYKTDYQYTKIDVRNENGSIVGAKYYFWVEDSTVVRPNKSMSLVQAKSILKNGPSEYMAFEQLVEDKKAYDSIVIAGLNTYVTNNGTYKLRLANNNTLRDDPEDLNLRNVHAEWTLIRKSQNSRIPRKLWDQLTDAAAGADVGGNPLPAQSRVDYDARNGTRTRFGFKPGQIFADTDLVRSTIKHTILNTSLELKIGGTVIPDYIRAVNFDDADEWFKDAETARATMELIWSSARAKQINEIFFAVLEDALANNYEFTDIFKTSFVSVYTTTTVEERTEAELEDGIN
jgi:hypothetical protein